jgi:hypothetical protein
MFNMEVEDIVIFMENKKIAPPDGRGYSKI